MVRGFQRRQGFVCCSQDCLRSPQKVSQTGPKRHRYLLRYRRRNPSGVDPCSANPPTLDERGEIRRATLVRADSASANRGYIFCESNRSRLPAPTNKFRWCTDRLRIDPVRRIIGATHEKAIVLLGTRYGESTERVHTLNRQASEKRYFYRQSSNPRVKIFAPIVDFDTADVWNALFQIAQPAALDAVALADLYRAAGSDCPVIRDPQGSPCGAGRFGCWTCTVVRTDRAVSSMVEEGYDELAPLLDFRNWLALMRDDPTNRCRFRRNGNRGLGPLTLQARRTILRRLRGVQARVPWRLLRQREIRQICKLWRQDRRSTSYRE